MRQAEVWDPSGPSKHPPPLRSIPSVHEPARRFQPTLGRCVLVAARRLLPTTGKMQGTSTRQCGILWHFDHENCSSNILLQKQRQQRQQHHHQKKDDIESRALQTSGDPKTTAPKRGCVAGQSRCWNAGADASKQPANHESSSPRPPKVGHFRLRAWSEFGAFSGFTGCGKKPLMRHCWHLVDVQLSYLLCLFGRCEVSEYISSNVLRSGTFRRCGAIKMLCAQCRGSHIAVMTLESGHDLFFEPGRKQQMPKSVW